MSSSESSLQTFCKSISALSPEDRYQRLKELKGNELFFDVIRLMPRVWQEFLSFEKRTELESSLVRQVSMAMMQQLIKGGTEGLGPTSLTSLVDQWTEEDEFWLFESIPGDKGYALVREGRILDYSIIEVTST